MFDKRLMKLCPESRRYIAGNILFQWLELVMNAVMILTVAGMVQQLYLQSRKLQEMLLPFLVILGTIALRFGTAKARAKLIAAAPPPYKNTNSILMKLYKSGCS